MKYGSFKKVHHKRQRRSHGESGDDPHYRQCKICGWWFDDRKRTMTGRSDIDVSQTDDNGNTIPVVRGGRGCPHCGSENAL
jgi:hypothetical protein